MKQKTKRTVVAWLMSLVMIMSVMMIPGDIVKAAIANNAELRIHGNPARQTNDGKIEWLTGEDEVIGAVEVYYTTVDNATLEDYTRFNGYNFENVENVQGNPSEGTQNQSYISLPADTKGIELRVYPAQGYNFNTQLFTEYTTGRKDDGTSINDKFAREKNDEVGEYLSYKFNDIDDLTRVVFQVGFDIQGGGGGNNTPAEKGKITFDCRDYAGIGGKIYYKLDDDANFTELTRTNNNYDAIDVTSHSKITIKVERNAGYRLGHNVSLRTEQTDKDERFSSFDDETINELVSANGKTFNLADYAVVKEDGSVDISDTSYRFEFEFQQSSNVGIIIGGETTYIIEDDKPAKADYVLIENERRETVFTGNDRPIKNIGLEKNADHYDLIIDGYSNTDAELFITGSDILIAPAGENVFKSIFFGKGINVEMRPGNALPKDGGNEGENNRNDDSTKPVTTVTVAEGIYADDNNSARRLGLRDDVKLVIGSKNNKAVDAFKNIECVELYNYDFHKHGNYENNEIYAQNVFKNVGLVEQYFSYTTIDATNLFTGETMANIYTGNNTDNGEGYEYTSSKGIYEVFQEAQLTYNSDIVIPNGAKLLDRYYHHYPDNSKPFSGRTKNAGIIAYGEVDNEDGINKGQKYIQVMDVTEMATKNDASDETSQEGHYIFTVNTDNTRTIKSIDPIIYSVMYNVDEDGDGEKILQYTENNETKEIKLTNGNCGQVEMKDFTKGYYIKDGSHGKFEAWIAAGEDVTVVLMPNTGYQYVGNTLNINGQVVTGVAPSDEVGHYTFKMFKSAGHISAGFRNTEDVVAVSDDAAVSGVSITGTENVIEAGNAKLEVSEANVGDEDKAKISAVADDPNAEFKYIDFTLNQYVVKNYDESKDTQDAWETQLTDLKDAVGITVDIPTDLSGASSYKVVRLHDGEANVLPVTVTDNTLAFETDKFSTYAIVKLGDGGNGNENEDKAAKEAAAKKAAEEAAAKKVAEEAAAKKAAEEAATKKAAEEAAAKKAAEEAAAKKAAEEAAAKNIGKTKILIAKNNKGKKLLVKVKAVAGATGYQVRYSLKKSMKGSKTKKLNGKTSVTFTKLKKKTYYIQARSYTIYEGKTYYSKWSAKKSVKVKK